MAKQLHHAIIVGHPSTESFTMSVAERYAARVRSLGQTAEIRDLYRMKFDPVLKEEERRGETAADVVEEWKCLEKADILVLVYPIWFGGPPATIKGYIDRVFGAGRTRGAADADAPSNKLQGKHLVSLTLSGSMRAWLDEKGVLGSLRNLFDRYLCDVFCLPEAHSFHFDGIAPDLPERDYRFHLAKVDEAADAVLERIGREWQMLPPYARD